MNTRVLCSAIAGFLVLAALTPLAAFADGVDGKQGQCQIQGSWMGYDPDGMANFVATHSGTNSKAGTSMLESPGFDLTLGGFFPTADQTTVGRGAWEKTGGRTYGWTAVGLVVDSDGNSLYLWKIAAINELGRDCNELSVPSNSIEFFYASANPYEDVPFHTVYGTPHTAMRITVDPPAVP